MESGQRVAEVARSLGVVEQTLSNWIKAHKFGKLVADRKALTPLPIPEATASHL